MIERAREILSGIGAKIDPSATLKDLGTASKHLVAIARALSIDASVVIMDEPTAALSQKEIEELYELVERLKLQGKAIMFISHKFDEIFRIADFYTVYRDGEMVGEGAIEDVSEPERGHRIFAPFRRDSWVLRIGWSGPLGIHASTLWDNPPLKRQCHD